MGRIGHHRPQYPDLFGQFKKSYHLEMVMDRGRTDAVFAALRRTLQADTVFCELGCGTALFSIFAASRCKHVYAVELDPAMIAVAQANISGSRFADRITLIEGDALSVELPEKLDAVFCEMMSIWTIEEPQVIVANRARRDLLKPGGLFMPTRIVNLVELGHCDFHLRDIQMKAAMPLFTGIPRPAVMTERRVCKVLDFQDRVDPDLSASVELEAVATGPVNCAVLSSIVQMGPEVVFSGTDSLMPPTVAPLRDEFRADAGDRIRFRAVARARSDIGEATFLGEVQTRAPAN